MDLTQLEYFVRVAQTGSFTRASIMLSVTQPALSKRIRQLEVELRQTLFNRNGRGITLTEEGRILFDHAKGILEQVRRARDALHEAKASPVGKVIIAAPPAPGSALSASFISAFRSRFPRASLEIIEEKSRIICEWLLMGRVDIGILYDPPENARLDLTPLGSHSLYLISPRGTPLVPKTMAVQFKDLGRLPLILPSLPHAIRAVVEMEAARRSVKLNVALELEGASLILACVQRGHGYTIMGDFSLQRSKLSSMLQENEIVRPRLTRVLKIATSLERPVTPLARETVALVKQHCTSLSEPIE